MKRKFRKYFIRMILTLFNVSMIYHMFLDEPDTLEAVMMVMAAIVLPILVSFIGRLVSEPTSVEIHDDSFTIRTLLSTNEVDIRDIDHVVLCLHSKKTAMLIIKGNKKFYRFRKMYFPDFDDFCNDLEDICQDRFSYTLRKYSSLFLSAKPYLEKVKWQELYSKPSIMSYFISKKFLISLIILLALSSVFMADQNAFTFAWISIIFVIIGGLLNYRRGYSHAEAIRKSLRWLLKTGVTAFSLVYFLIDFLDLLS
ncbi:hypothetical protein EZV73_07525 [Acidaminobacter sp. JC074]|uniref:hypothetical protein n=1 Tax=Acidaminobacter sp. JC074 TaxID=2530199 RepID=UPI001F0E9343|nr:hypothetical protein [Acidaminobacter sp. JC074]MCH4887415.1 hypothetical protein [Acidaminobacter sp. JC074]